MRRMRHFISVCVVLAAVTGCQFDPVATCESRCEEGKSLGCESAGTDCQNNCVLADDVYDEGLEHAQDAGCVAEYDTAVSCWASTPACASQTVINEMCAEEALVLNSCLSSGG